VAPVLVPLAVLVGLVLDRLLRSTDGAAHRFSWILVCLLYAPAALDLLRDDGVEYLLESATTNGEVPEALLPGLPLAALLLTIGAVLALSILTRSSVATGALALVVACFAVFYGGVFVPRLDAVKSMKGVCDVWKRQRGAGQRVGFHGPDEAATYFYCDARVEIVHKSTFLSFMDPERPAFCIIDRAAGSELDELYQAQFPDGSLYVVDDRHERYALIANHLPGRSGPTGGGPLELQQPSPDQLGDQAIGARPVMRAVVAPVESLRISVEESAREIDAGRLTAARGSDEAVPVRRVATARAQ
jgi:hypothetical protein